MIAFRLLAVALVLLPLSSGVPDVQPREQAQKQRVTLGVMRSDAVLLPFAAFDGDKWSMPWPSGIGGGREGGPSELPASLAAVPADWWGKEAPATWRLWPRDSQAGVIFKLVRPAMVIVGATRRLGIRTDYRPANPLIPPFELPYPKEGMAVGGEATVEQVSTVSRLAPANQKLVERLRPDIDAAEERTIRTLRAAASWTHPFDKAIRAKVVPELEAWYTSALVEAGLTASYIEAVKKYPVLPQDKGCGLESFISGWVHQNEREDKPKSQLKVVVTYCDRDKASYMLPLGQMRLRNRTHWVFQMSGQDHEWYAVAELTPGRTRIVVEYYAGGFPRGFLR